jgi:hypothetical protein
VSSLRYQAGATNDAESSEYHHAADRDSSKMLQSLLLTLHPVAIASRSSKVSSRSADVRMEASSDAEKLWPILSRRTALAAVALAALNPLPALATDLTKDLTGEEIIRAGIYQREIELASDGLDDLQFLLRGSTDAKLDIRNALRRRPVNKLRNAAYKLEAV